MRHEIYSAFDGVHASRERKERTKAFVARRMAQAASRTRRNWRWAIAAAAACLVLAAGLGGHWLYFTPTAAISIDVNPSLELEVNRFDRVIALEGYNADGQALAAQLDVDFLSYEQAVAAILGSQAIVELMQGGEALTITVTGEDQSQCGRILSHMEQETADLPNTHCYSAHHDEVEAAHNCGLSYGRYQAYLELLTLGAEITPEEVAEMSMREIQELLRTLSGESQSGWSAGHHAEEGHGQGSGHGKRAAE